MIRRKIVSTYDAEQGHEFEAPGETRRRELYVHDFDSKWWRVTRTRRVTRIFAVCAGASGRVEQQ